MDILFQTNICWYKVLRTAGKFYFIIKYPGVMDRNNRYQCLVGFLFYTNSIKFSCELGIKNWQKIKNYQKKIMNVLKRNWKIVTYALKKNKAHLKAITRSKLSENLNGFYVTNGGRAVKGAFSNLGRENALCPRFKSSLRITIPIIQNLK